MTEMELYEAEARKLIDEMKMKISNLPLPTSRGMDTPKSASDFSTVHKEYCKRLKELKSRYAICKAGEQPRN